jgi:predicted nucleic acid-binding protein
MRKYLLDSSFVIDLLNELADNNDEGPALRWLKRNRRAHLWISPVTLAEVLEGADDPQAVKAYLGRYAWQGIHRMQAEGVALRQKRAARRMGENDAWQAAVAECMKGRVLAHDAAFVSLGAAYEDYRLRKAAPG